MKLSQKQEGITNLTVSDEKERKQLWDEWKNKHPDSKKTWRTNKKQGPNTLRCQATVIIKKVSATVKIEPANSERSGSIGFGNDDDNSEDTNSVHSETTDGDGWANSGDTESIHSGISDIDGLENFGRTNSINSEVSEMNIQLDMAMPQSNIETHRPLLSNPNRENQETNEVVISKIYIDDETLAQWSKENLMAYTFPVEPFPVRAPSETNRYETRRFYEFIPEEMRKIKKEEKEFFEEESIRYPQLELKNIKTEWITFLCHEEILTQGDIDEHVATSHGFEMSEIKDEYRIQRNKVSNLVLREAMDIRTQSENSMDKLMESWHGSAIANNILFSDNGRTVDKIRPEKSMLLLDAISKAISPTMMETLKINLGNKLEKNQNVNTSFSCTWKKVEEAIYDSLGQSPNIERLNKCMEPKDWGETTLQQALQNINNFHNTTLNSKKMMYKDENGELKEYVKHKESMKVTSAFELLKKLPDKFDTLKHEIMTDMSNAYYDPETNYEKIIEKAEKRIKERGLIML